MCVCVQVHVCVCVCVCVYSGVLLSALTQDNMCESLSIAHESTQAQPAKGKTGQERDRGERDGEGIGKEKGKG